MCSDRPARTVVPLVLVVDDTFAVLDLVREALEDAGYRVATCLVSRDALRLARELVPAVVMLDLMMPEMSGWEVLAQLRTEPLLARVPVVICTAFVEEALGRVAEIRGATAEGGVTGSTVRELGLLPKPFEVDELLEVIGSLVGPARAVSLAPERANGRE